MQISSGTYSPVTFFQGRFNDMYGVHGYGRGFRWDGDSAQVEPIGMAAPTAAPTVSSAATSQRFYISNIQMVTSGAGYHGVPTVTLSGGSATTAAVLRANVDNGRVVGVEIVDPGSGYQSTPTVVFDGGIGSSAAFTVGYQGGVEFIEVTNSGSGYTGPPTVSVATSYGLTGANFAAVVSDGRVVSVEVLARGDGATSQPVLSFSGASGTSAAASPIMNYRVTAVTVANSGVNYFTPPVISVVPDPADAFFGEQASLTCSVTSGGVQAVTIVRGGAYSKPPTAKIIDTSAKAQASIAKTIQGKYQLAVRYVDDTPESQNGPIPSNISAFAEVDAEGGVQSLTWTWSNANADARAHKVELWRTTADQAVVLYRVASLSKVAGVLPTTYTESLTDRELADPERTDYGLMPVVLPSGQLNARRFGIPPTNMAIACVFQDRAWYALDTSGAKPNSLYFSEIDEPESVPEENEVILQENTTEPDAIAALIPFGTSLLVAQRRHIYKLQYVSQPVIDASVILAAYRGVLNNRCWAVMGGVCFLADSYGMYAFDGSGEEAISLPVDNYWRDGLIDFSKQQYFYVQATPTERVIRFFYCKATDGTYPKRALCYCAATKAWWEEEYAQQLPHGTVARISGKQTVVSGGEAGGFIKHSGPSDVTAAGASAAIAYNFRTHSARLADEPSRAIGVLYKPTSDSSDLKLALHYNNSSSPRANAISTDRGGGFVTTLGGTVATLDMKLARSALGDSRGYAKAHYSGRLDDRSVGADRHLAVDISGTQAVTAGNEVTLHGLTVEGVG